MQFAWWLCHPKPSSNSEDVKHETALMLLQIKAGTETFGTAPCGPGPKAEGVSPERKSMNAEYLDSRDGTTKKGKELTNGRISRNHMKDHKNLHQYRGKKLSKGRITIRRGRSSLKSGSLVRFNGELLTVHGTHRSRKKNKAGHIKVSVNVEFERPSKTGRKSAALSKCQIISRSYNTGWKQIQL